MIKVMSANKTKLLLLIVDNKIERSMDDLSVLLKMLLRQTLSQLFSRSVGVTVYLKLSFSLAQKTKTKLNDGREKRRLGYITLLRTV